MKLRLLAVLSLSLLMMGTAGLVAPVVYADEGDTQAGYNDITGKGGPWVRIVGGYERSGCSGTLLAPQKVITARHCAGVPESGKIQMFVESNLPPDPGCEEKRVTVTINGVVQKPKHPCTTEADVVAVQQHPTEDIAILTLKHVLPGTYPAKLASYDANLLSRQTRAGWHIPVRLVGRRSPSSPNDFRGMFYGDGFMRSFGCGSRCPAEARYFEGVTEFSADVRINHNPIHTNVPGWPGDSGGGIFRNDELIGIFTHGNSQNWSGGPVFTDAVRAWMIQSGVFNPMQYTYPDSLAPAKSPQPSKPKAPPSVWSGMKLPKVPALSFLNRKQVSVSRISGSSRVGTSLALFERVNNKSVAVLATGRDFPDGLVGGNLAGVLKSGVVLTASESLEPEILATLRENGTKKVYLVGGESAVIDQ